MKWSKLIFRLAVAVAVPAAANHLLFRYHNKLAERERERDRVYHWRHGDIHYTKMGSGQPLLLIHDIYWGASRWEWEKNVESLSRRHTVYALDLLGFGRSDKPGVTYSAYLYTSLINDFAREVINASVSVAASGYGAAYAVMAYQFQPRFYRKLLLIAPAGLTSFLPGVQAWSNLRPSCLGWVCRRLLETPVFGTALYNLFTSKPVLRYYACRGFRQTRGIDQWVKHCSHMARVGGANGKLPLAQWLDGGLEVDIREKLRRVEIPVALVWGDGNRWNPAANANALARQRPDIPLTVVENAGCVPHREKASVMNEIMSKFL